MKLVIISDTHGYLRERDIPPGDVLIHCGDACSTGRPSEMYAFAEVMRQLQSRFRLMLYTPGNHDRCVEGNPTAWRSILSGVGVTLLLNGSLTFDGVKFFGSPMTPRFQNWAFMYEPAEAVWIWRNIPDDADVVFTHGQPYGINDQSGRLIPFGGKVAEEHFGCPALRDRLLEVKPKVYAGGHLHFQGGQQIKVGETVYINAAICDDSYRPTRKPVEVEI